MVGKGQEVRAWQPEPVCVCCVCVHARVCTVYRAAARCVVGEYGRARVLVCICMHLCEQDVCLCLRMWRVRVSSECAGVCVYVQQACVTHMHIVQGVCEMHVLVPGSAEPPCPAPLALGLPPGGPRGPQPPGHVRTPAAHCPPPEAPRGFVTSHSDPTRPGEQGSKRGLTAWAAVRGVKQGGPGP